MPFILSATLGVAGFLLLSITYMGFENQWPSSYRTLADTYGMRVTARLWRLVAFRAIPVVTVSTLVGTLTWRAGGIAWLAITVSCTLHLLATNGRAFVNGLVPGRPEALINYGSYHVLAAAITALSGVGASALLPISSHVVPSNQSLIDSIWTAGLLAVLGGFLLRVTSTGNDASPDVAYMFDRVRRDVGIETLDYAFEQAAQNRADPWLVRSVLTAEALQRPAWLRTAERLLGRIRRTGSYGVMQMRSNRPITDRESIERFCIAHAGAAPFSVTEFSPVAEPRYQALRGIAGHHNGDAQFTDAVIEFYAWFAANSEWLTTAQGGSIGVIEKRYYVRELGLRLATDAAQLEIRVGSDVTTRSAPVGWQPSGWWWLEVRSPLTESAVGVRVDSLATFIPVDLNRTGYFI